MKDRWFLRVSEWFTFGFWERGCSESCSESDYLCVSVQASLPSTQFSRQCMYVCMASLFPQSNSQDNVYMYGFISLSKQVSGQFVYVYIYIYIYIHIYIYIYQNKVQSKSQHKIVQWFCFSLAQFFVLIASIWIGFPLGSFFMFHVFNLSLCLGFVYCMCMFNVL